MAVSTARITEMPIRVTAPITSRSASSLRLRFFFYTTPKPFFSLLKSFCSLRTTENSRTNKHPHAWGDDPPNPTKTPDPREAQASKPSSSSWINEWPSPSPPVESNTKQDEDGARIRYFDGKSAAGTNAIERIVLRLRNLGLGSDDEEEEDERGENLVMSVAGDEKMGELLRRDWVRPDKMLFEDEDEPLLPWERVEERGQGEEKMNKKRMVRAPSLAELTIEVEELRRLRGLGMTIRERITVPKAGVTGAVLEKIHYQWRKSELVRLKFHETLAHDMKTAHKIVERRSGGLVIWRSGSVMMVFRGSNYEGPCERSELVDREGDTLFEPDVSSSDSQAISIMNGSLSVLEKSKMPISDHVRSMTEDEVEYNCLLDGLGPRFEDWWGTGLFPVDADMLPQTIPGYKTPFRLLPAGMRSRLTNAEMTNLRKLARSLPCHFALGRNRNHQGLAAAIIKLWEKSLVVKIAVKPGIQNTNNKLMAEEIKAQAKLHRAEKLLAKLEASMIPVGPSADQEMITVEERSMFRRVGLRMKAYLPIGIRGVFDGVIENMHLHWKHRELVKLISKQKNLAFVEETARLLEHESGGILVAIERVPKGHAIIYYRGKNYRRPISMRPRNLLTKSKALKRSIAMQRHEALTQHISELERTIDQMKSEVGDCSDVDDEIAWKDRENLDQVLEFTQNESDKASGMDSDSDADGNDWEDNDEDEELLDMDHYDLPSRRKS